MYEQFWSTITKLLQLQSLYVGMPVNEELERMLKQPWPILRYLPSIYPEGMSEVQNPQLVSRLKFEHGAYKI
jgi:hypothetical protein